MQAALSACWAPYCRALRRAGSLPSADPASHVRDLLQYGCLPSASAWASESPYSARLLQTCATATAAQLELAETEGTPERQPALEELVEIGRFGVPFGVRGNVKLWPGQADEDRQWCRRRGPR